MECDQLIRESDMVYTLENKEGGEVNLEFIVVGKDRWLIRIEQGGRAKFLEPTSKLTIINFFKKSYTNTNTG